MNIAIVGGGYVGLHTAIKLAETNKNWKINVLDIEDDKINKFNNGESPIDDYYMRKFLKENYSKLSNIKYFKNKNEYNDFDIVFITLSTNPEKENDSRLNTNTIFNISKLVKEKYNIPVIIRSTLNIDDYDKLDNLNLCYWPEFLSQGVKTESNINQLVNVISLDNSEVANKLFKEIFFNKTLLYTSSKEAILTKVMHNSLDAYLITLSNLFANISHENNISFDKISPIVEQLLLNRPKVKKSGLGYGGSCYPKDSYSLINITNRKEDKDLIEALNNFNINQANQFLLFEDEIRAAKNIVVLGSSFKGGTNDVTKTPTLPLRNWLIKNDINYKIWEPQFVKCNLIKGEILSECIDEDLNKSDLVIVSSDWKEFSLLLQNYKGIVIDLKSCIDPKGKYKLLKIAKNNNMKRVNVFGLGPAGSIIARRYAELGHKVFCYEIRDHIAGNLYDYKDVNGVYVHKYGPHIFQTSDKEVIEYVKQFSEWIEFRHKVNVVIDEKEVPLPINFESIDKIFDNSNLIKEKLKKEFKSDIIFVSDLLKSNDKEIKSFGEFVYKKVFENYTTKMWDINPKDIDPSVLKRVPIRLSYDDGYFNDSFQAVPKDGYTNFIKNILNHENIEINLSTPKDSIYVENKELVVFNKKNNQDIIVYTGPIDALFRYEKGEVPYRSLKFEFEKKNQIYNSRYVVNYPNHPTMTRITDYRLLSQQKLDSNAKGTTIGREYPGAYNRDSVDFNEPYYPINNKKNDNIVNEYLNKVKSIDNLIVLGRLAEYKYKQMGHSIKDALNKELI